MNNETPAVILWLILAVGIIIGIFIGVIGITSGMQQKPAYEIPAPVCITSPDGQHTACKEP